MLKSDLAGVKAASLGILYSVHFFPNRVILMALHYWANEYLRSTASSLTDVLFEKCSRTILELVNS